MKKLISIIIALAVCGGALAQVAQQLVSKYFSGKSVSLVKIDTDFFDKGYDVIFTDGNKIEFDRKGNWTDVDCEYSMVPSGIVPAGIMKYVKDKYPAAKVIHIVWDNRHYDVELSNDIELKFNKSLRLVDIDR